MTNRSLPEFTRLHNRVWQWRNGELATRVWTLAILLIMGCSWGLSFSLAKIATSSGAHPFGVTFWQSLVGAVILLIFLGVRSEKPSFHPAALRLFVMCGLLGAALPGILFYLAAAHLSAGVLSISVALIPILTFLLSSALKLESMSILRLAGVILGAVSILILVIPGQSLPDSQKVPWVFVACAAASCYALWNIVVAIWRDRRTGALTTTCGMYFSATAMMLFVCLITRTFFGLSVPFGPVEWAIIGMGVISAVAYGLFIYLVHLSGPVFASQASYIVTISGVVWGMLIFDEQHSVSFWLSLLIMCIGLMLTNPRRQGQMIE